jgi:fluoroacetyl-CoA thioesterase
MKRAARKNKKRNSRRSARPNDRQRSAPVVGVSFSPGASSPSVLERPRLGLQASVEVAVPHEWTIQHYDSRLPAVLSTPAMIGMMEMAAAQAVQPDLSPGTITVGTRIEVDHLKPVTTGATVRAQARLVAHDGRFLIFEVEARSGQQVIGRGRVFRAIVEPAKFATAAGQHPAAP